MEELYKYAAEKVKDADPLGLGTGRTVRGLIKYLHEAGALKGKTLVTSSVDTELALAELGYVVSGLTVRPKAYVDGFDAFLEEEFVLIKGGGGAMTREKILAYNSDFRLYIGDSSKVKRDKFVVVPVEVLSFALHSVLRKLRMEGFEASVRVGQGKMGPVVSDNGNPIVDVTVERGKLRELTSVLDSIPGVVEHGVFYRDLIEEVAVFDNGLVKVRVK